MAETVELVIKITEHNKNIIDRFVNGEGFDVLPTPLLNQLVAEVRNGTVLPKGHGRLIAEPTVADILDIIGGRNDFAECIREAVSAVFHIAPTIIKADSEVE